MVFIITFVIEKWCVSFHLCVPWIFFWIYSRSIAPASDVRTQWFTQACICRRQHMDYSYTMPKYFTLKTLSLSPRYVVPAFTCNELKYIVVVAVVMRQTKRKREHFSCGRFAHNVHLMFWCSRALTTFNHHLWLAIVALWHLMTKTAWHFCVTQWECTLAHTHTRRNEWNWINCRLWKSIHTGRRCCGVRSAAITISDNFYRHITWTPCHGAITSLPPMERQNTIIFINLM